MTPGRLKIWNEDAGEWQYTPGGETVTVKHVVVPVTFADISAATGFADLYLLPENETVVNSWPVVTVAFNGVAGGLFPFQGAQATGPSGTTGNGIAGDPFDCTAPSATLDGLTGGDPSGGPGSTVIKMIPLVSPAPGGGSVQLIIDFPAQGGTATTPGTTGALDYHLVIAVS